MSGERLEESEYIARSVARTIRAPGSRSTIFWKPKVEQNIAAKVTKSLTALALAHKTRTIDMYATTRGATATDHA